MKRSDHIVGGELSGGDGGGGPTKTKLSSNMLDFLKKNDFKNSETKVNKRVSKILRSKGWDSTPSSNEGDEHHDTYDIDETSFASMSIGGGLHGMSGHHHSFQSPRGHASSLGLARSNRSSNRNRISHSSGISSGTQSSLGLSSAHTVSSVSSSHHRVNSKGEFYQKCHDRGSKDNVTSSSSNSSFSRLSGIGLGGGGNHSNHNFQFHNHPQSGGGTSKRSSRAKLGMMMLSSSSSASSPALTMTSRRSAQRLAKVSSKDDFYKNKIDLI